MQDTRVGSPVPCHDLGALQNFGSRLESETAHWD